MLMRCVLASVMFGLASEAVGAFSVQSIGVTVKVDGAPVLNDCLREPGRNYLSQTLVKMLQGQLSFWLFQPADDKDGLPRLTIDLTETTKPGQAGTWQRALTVCFSLEASKGGQLFYQSEDLTVIDVGVYDDVVLQGQEKSLAQRIHRPLQKQFMKLFDACERKFREFVPIAHGVVNGMNPQAIVVPLECERFRPYATSTFEVVCEFGNLVSKVLYRGMGQHQKVDGRCYLVLAPEDPGKLPSAPLKYKEIKVKEPAFRFNEDLDTIP